MRVIEKLFYGVLSLAASAGMSLGAPEPAPGFGAQTNLPVMAAELRHEEGPGQLPADRAYVVAGTNKFAFLIPAGFKLETLNDRLVALATRDYSCQITFRLAGPLPSEGELDTNTYSATLIEEHPGAKVINSFAAFADSRSGPAFEVELPGAVGSWRRAEFAFIPSRAGVLEFGLICSPEKFERGRQQLSTVMLTFRASDAQGQLHIAPLSDRL